MLPQETLTAVKVLDNVEDPPPSPLPSGEESTPPLVPSHPSNTPGESMGGVGELPGRDQVPLLRWALCSFVPLQMGWPSRAGTA